jgi:osmoprotectant transport system ATP-binding protein
LLALRSIGHHIKPIEGLAPTHCIANSATVREAISLMAAHQVAALRVADQSGQVIGMVNANDCLESKHA